MLSRISVVFRLLTITAVSLLALAGVGVIGVLSTGTIQEMVSRTETDALKPIEQISELNERLQESFREILLALQHNPTLPAIKYHNHAGFQRHLDGRDGFDDALIGTVLIDQLDLCVADFIIDARPVFSDSGRGSIGTANGYFSKVVNEKCSLKD